jgi:hypothetical protein
MLKTLATGIKPETVQGASMLTRANARKYCSRHNAGGRKSSGYPPTYALAISTRNAFVPIIASYNIDYRNTSHNSRLPTLKIAYPLKINA